MLLVFVYSRQHERDGIFTHGRAHPFERYPFEFTQIGVAFTNGLKNVVKFLRQLIWARYLQSLDGLHGDTRCNGAQLDTH